MTMTRRDASGFGQVRQDPFWVEATFVAGCSLRLGEEFRRVPCVVDVTSGYAGAAVKLPFCARTLSGSNGQVESVRMVFNPAAVSCETVLRILWTSCDSSQADMQCAHPAAEGRLVVFYHDEGQRLAAEASHAALVHSRELRATSPVAILRAGRFRPAGDNRRTAHSRRREEEW
jgi:peptide methionine sulfoxide reductase MsrA